MAAEVGIGLLGLGVVGSGVARALVEKAPALVQQAGRPLALRRVLVRDLHKPRTFNPGQHFLTRKC